MLSLFVLVGALVRRHEIPVAEHLDSKTGEQHARDIVRVESRDEFRDDVAEQSGENRHHSQRTHGAGVDHETRVSHGHDGSDEEGLVAELGDDDDGYRGDKCVDESEVRTVLKLLFDLVVPVVSVRRALLEVFPVDEDLCSIG